MFQPQVNGIIEYINEQLSIVNDYNKVTHLVLAGGLCGSQHVQQQINECYGEHMYILITDVPEIAVAKGLVLDRIMEIRYKVSILGTSRPTLSYGIIPNHLSYHSSSLVEKHSNKNPYDHKNWETNAIDWIICCNETLDRSKPIERDYERYFDSNEAPATGTESWYDSIFISYAPERRRLPYSDDDGDAQEILVIECSLDREFLGDLEGVDLRVDKHVFHKDQTYYAVKTKLAVQMGNRELIFEIKVGDRVIGKGAVDIKWNLAADADSGFEEEIKQRKPVRRNNGIRALLRKL
jgi:hypothetical protein